MKQETSGGEPTLYVLLVFVRKTLRLDVGALGAVEAARGVYAYVGSAKRALRLRLARHFRREKPLRWHIDYLTTKARPFAAIVVADEKLTECGLAEQIRRAPFLIAAAPRFGSSDCRCEGHLFRIQLRRGEAARKLADYLRRETPEATVRVLFPFSLRSASAGRRGS